MNQGRPRFGSALLAEALGTALLLAIVVGSGIMSEQLAQGNAAIALLANSIATGCGLFVLIVVFAPASGAHFNPLISLLAWSDSKLNAHQTLACVGVQLGAAVAGTLLAHAMFGLTLVELGTHRRTGAGQFLSEVVATTGLVLVIRGTTGRNAALIAASIAAYIAAAYWFTASTAFANPAVTIARSLTASFAGIAPVDVPAFILAQGIGAFVGSQLSKQLYPTI